MSEKPYPLSAAEWNWDIIQKLENLDYEEDSYLEYKTRLVSDSDTNKKEWGRKIEREITAFANSHGGILLFGMSDSRKPTGFERPENESAQIVNQYIQNTTPLVSLDTSSFIHHPHRENIGFLAVEVKEANTKPVATSDAAYYIRTAKGKSPMTREHIQSLFVDQDRRQQSVLRLLLEMDWLESAYDSHIDISNPSGLPAFGVIDTEALRDAIRNATHLYTQSKVRYEIKYVLKYLRDIDELNRNYGRHKSPNAANPDTGHSWTDKSVRRRFKKLVENVILHSKILREEAQLEQRFENEFR